MDDTGCEYRQARILFSILFTVAPEVAHDPNLGNRSVFVTGVTRITTVNDLIKLFPLSTDGVAAAVVRDFDTGERAGLVVLANEADCDEAIASPVVKCLKRKQVKDCESSRKLVLASPLKLTSGELLVVDSW